MSTDSEFRAYPYIQGVLSRLGWDTRNPARGGAVYTQGEFRRHDTLLTSALGRKAPENAIVIPWQGGPRYWLVEAKPKHPQRKQALREAQAYADRINSLEPGSARFATGSPAPPINPSMSPQPIGTVVNGVRLRSITTKLWASSHSNNV